ncbi:hypothetical protein EI94DRAFT_1792022 [Lactarius quietus]|nr:hypothetical protein EI94DRAFT_1792022 [Lactarius quietus]
MLSRLSSLLVYVVAGLVISAAATPMGPPSEYNEEPKARPLGPSYPQSYAPHPKYPYSKSYQMDKAYAPRGEDKPYPRPYSEEKKYSEKKHSEEKPYPKPHPEEKKYLSKSSDDKGKERKADVDQGRKSDDYKDRKSADYTDRKSYDNNRKSDDDRDRKVYDDKDRKSDDYKDRKSADYTDRKSYDNGRKSDDDRDRKVYNDKDRKYKDQDDHSYGNNQCNVGEQHCCESTTSLEEAKSTGLLALMGWADLTQFTGVLGKNCSPMWGVGAKCEASPVCCENVKTEGIFTVGCSNVDAIF